MSSGCEWEQEGTGEETWKIKGVIRLKKKGQKERKRKAVSGDRTTTISEERRKEFDDNFRWN